MRKGFTLIEIMIVVAIIALLAGTILIGAAPTQRLGRDTRRIADLRQVQNSLQLYYSKCGYYPGGVQANPACGNFNASQMSWSAMETSLTQSSIGVFQIPKDPKNGQSYFYGVDTTNGLSYVIGATLEDVNNSALQSDVDGTVYGIDCNDPVYCIEF